MSSQKIRPDWTSLGELKTKQKILIGIAIIATAIAANQITIAYGEYKEVRAEADQVWTQHLERQDNKDGNGARVEETQDTDSEAQSLVPSREEKQPERVADMGSESSPPGKIEEKIRETFKECPDVAVAVAKAESQLVSDQIGDGHLTYQQNGTTYGFSVGIFQIRYLPGRPDPEKLKDPDFNIKYAYEMYQKSGLYPWSAWKNGSYQKYL